MATRIKKPRRDAIINKKTRMMNALPTIDEEPIKSSAEEPENSLEDKSFSFTHFLNLYLKEVSKVPLLTQEEETHWARILFTGKKEKKALLKHAVQMLEPLQHNATVRDLLFLTKRFPWEDVHLKSALTLYKKIKKIKSRLGNTALTKEKRKLTKELLRAEASFSVVLNKINIIDLKGWKTLAEMNHPRLKENKLEKILQALISIRKRLLELEPEIRNARQKLVQGNLRLVLSISRHYSSRGFPMWDLIQEGNLGLIKAVEKFDYRKGFRFTTYASWWIREGITRSFQEKSRIIHVPVYVNEKYCKIKRALQESIRRQGKEPTFAELSRTVHMPVQEIIDIIAAFREPVSLETPSTEERDPLLNFLADQGPNPVDQLCRKLIIEQLGKIIATLPHRQATILQQRFGIGTKREKTLEEVAHTFHVSRERVRQMENQALQKLRKKREIKMLFSLLSTA